MLNDLLNNPVKSNFDNYVVSEVKNEPVILKRGNQQSEFCNALVKPSRDLPAIQQAANHNFEVEMKPVNVEGIVIPRAVIACEKGTTNHLGNNVVKEGYTPLQPDGLYDIANHILSLDESITVTDIVTKTGRSMIGLQFNKGEWSPTGELADKILNNLLLFTTFDGSRATSLRTISSRPICSNQYGGSKGVFSIRHTRNANNRIELLKRLLTKVNDEIEQLNADIQSLVYKAMNNGQAKDWFSKLLLDGKDYKRLEGRSKTTHDNKVSEFEVLLNRGAGCDAGKGTRYGAFNALTNYCTHERSTRVTGQRGSAAELRWESNLFGSSAEFAQQGFNELVKM